MSETATATGSAKEAEALMREICLSPMQGNVGVGANEWFVVIYGRRKRPPVTRWLGWPVRYNIGGGRPRAY